MNLSLTILFRYGRFIIILLLLLFSKKSSGQGAGELYGCGAGPIYICNLDSIQWWTVDGSIADTSYCTNRKSILTPCGTQSRDVSRDWYEFTCSVPGTLGFTITPDHSDEWNWELFDITGHSNLDDVYTDSSLIVACNWSKNTSNDSGYTSVTGTSPSASSLMVCFSNPPLTNESTFSAMPVLKTGHTYALLVCSPIWYHGAGYKMIITGGTAVYSYPSISLPHIDSLYPSCNALTLPVKLSQPIPCNSFNTTDFSISSPYNGYIKSVRGVGCSTGNFTDSLLVDLSIPLTLGTYTLYAKTKGNGSCENPPLFDSMTFTLPPIPVLLDSIVPPGCAPSTLQLVFKQDIDCGSVASDGSDFLLTGPSPTTIISATPVCINGAANSIILQLATPLLSTGAYSLSLKKGTDGTTLITTCGVSSPEGSSLSFNIPETVSANFTYQPGYGCNTDTLFYSAANSGAINYWNLGTQTSNQQNPVQVVSNALATLHVMHVVSNGFCSDTSFQNIDLSDLNPPLKASFTINDFTCPDSPAIVINNSSGNIVKWNWDFGDGVTSNQQSPPPHTYSVLSSSKDFIVTLIIQNTLGCADTAQAIIKAISNCSVLVPSAFTPNSDGLNDYFGPLNAYNTKDLVFRIYNRWGQLVFKTTNWKNKWGGTFGGNPQPAGIYIWFLSYTDTNTNSYISKRGTVMLIR